MVDIRCTTGGFAGNLAGTPAEHHPEPRYVWCGKSSMWPNEMVPLQIDPAIGMGRYLFGPLINPSERTIPLVLSPVDHGRRGSPARWGGRRCVACQCAVKPPST